MQHSRLPNNNGSTHESRKSHSRKSKNKTTFTLGTLRGLGCKGMAMPVPAFRSATEEINQTRRKKNKSPANLADTPDICCAPPGISYLSDVVPRPTMAAQPQRTTHIQNFGVAGRRDNRDNIQGISGPNSLGSLHNVLSRNQVSNARQSHHLYFRFIRESSDDEHQHRDWRLNVNTMSYEELLDLGNKIGQVSKGLCEEEIFHCLKISKLSSFLISTDKDWRCSICQEGWRMDDGVGKLGCGHCHHINCIRQWLLQKNQCPICKIPPIAHKARRTMN